MKNKEPYLYNFQVDFAQMKFNFAKVKLNLTKVKFNFANVNVNFAQMKFISAQMKFNFAKVKLNLVNDTKSNFRDMKYILILYICQKNIYLQTNISYCTLHEKRAVIFFYVILSYHLCMGNTFSTRFATLACIRPVMFLIPIYVK